MTVTCLTELTLLNEIRCLETRAVKTLDLLLTACRVI